MSDEAGAAYASPLVGFSGLRGRMRRAIAATYFQSIANILEFVLTPLCNEIDQTRPFIHQSLLAVLTVRHVAPLRSTLCL